MGLREIYSVVWIHLTQNRDRWQAVVNGVLILLAVAPLS
jgi:hypothetical protein